MPYRQWQARRNRRTLSQLCLPFTGYGGTSGRGLQRIHGFHATHGGGPTGRRRLHSSYEKGCQGKKLLPAPLRDAGVVTYIQPHLIPHLILRGGIGLVALARRTFRRRCQPQLLVPTRRFHEVSGARRRSVPKLRKL